MAKGVRVNLSVPERFDAVLCELAKHSGRSKASWVMEAIEFQLPSWWKRLEAMKYGTPIEALPTAENRGRVELARSQRQLRAVERYEEIKTKPVDALPSQTPHAEARAARVSPLNRQQRRALERADRKRLRRETHR